MKTNRNFKYLVLKSVQSLGSVNFSSVVETHSELKLCLNKAEVEGRLYFKNLDLGGLKKRVLQM